FSPWLFVRTVRLFFFFNDPATPEIYTLSLHDALPILADAQALGPQEVHDRVDALAVLQADFPVFFAAVDLEAALGQLVHRHLLRSEEHTSELQSRENLVCRLLLEKKKKKKQNKKTTTQ